ncbi:MAG: glycoside hydrolase family 78 protein [Bifidobacteriaceae bacterium]|jgi:alpha-L-rhamnosidase|nr:glycoside hydrolase family 78 protein [Bifidobacteriaceae bacterium]
MNGLHAIQLRCENAVEPLGIDVARPRFSWVIAGGDRGARQRAYQIRVSEADGDGRLMWDSGRVDSSDTQASEYDGAPLASCTRYVWTLAIWGDAAETATPVRSTFETGLMQAEGWPAEWIRGKNLFRAEFETVKPIVRARIYISGLGYHELRVNGRRVGNSVLDPGWTDYERIVLYAAHDVTDLLNRGANAIGVMLGNGRYSPYEHVRQKNWHPLKKYGPSPVLTVHGVIWHDDGSMSTLNSDCSWRTASGPIVSDDIYDGETYDARLERPGWDRPGFDDSGWAKATLVGEPLGRLVSQGALPPVRVIKSLTATRLTTPAPATYLYDFGQNFAGWLRLKVRGPAGAAVRIRTGELTHSGTGMINTNTNRGALSEDTYICRGEGLEEFEPHFTYHGFRYAELTGFPGTPSLDSLEAKVVHSAVQPIGGFSCSDQTINQIHQNYLWTQVSNLHSIPTDCCQRDERMGWIGDAYLSAEAAIFNFDMAAFYSKFQRDIRLAQYDSGSVSGVCPPYWECNPVDPTYAAACVEFPWLVSRYYGDPRIIQENLDGMCAWVDFLGTQEGPDGTVDFGQFGDWCPPMHAYPIETPTAITATWYYCHDALHLSAMARSVGRLDLAEKYQAVADRVAANFNSRFLQTDRYASSKLSDAELAERLKTWLQALPEEDHGEVMRRYATLYSASSQTANALPLWLGIVPPANEAAVAATLVNDIENTHARHLAVGVVGLKFVLDVLERYGHMDLALDTLTQSTYPSFGYQIREGATTLWERWEYLDSPKVFNSHSHPFSGSVDAWFYKALAGLRLADPRCPSGIVLRPELAQRLSYASASVETPRGIVSVDWRKHRQAFHYKVVVPGNTEALIYVPSNGWGTDVVVSESGREVFADGAANPTRGLAFIRAEESFIVFSAGGGCYQFVVRPDHRNGRNQEGRKQRQ